MLFYKRNFKIKIYSCLSSSNNKHATDPQHSLNKGKKWNSMITEIRIMKRKKNSDIPAFHISSFYMKFNQILRSAIKDINFICMKWCLKNGLAF